MITTSPMRSFGYKTSSRECLSIRGRLDGRRSKHAAGVDGAHNGEDFPSTVGGGFMSARASRTTRVEACHLR